ncbi:MAG: LTA synthase family protein [Alistipes sp.]
MRPKPHSALGMVVWRIALLYVVLMLCRTVFYLYNFTTLGALSWGELGALLRGALLFDTASVVYADGLFVLLSLVPLHLREHKWYQWFQFGYYVVVNALLVVAVNLADAVYFRYTYKRFTADEIFFADNSNSGQLLLKFLTENWFMALFGVAMIALLAIGYRRRTPLWSPLRGWLYYAVHTLILGCAAGLCIAGVRGGMTRMTRPITLSNAALYAADNAKANLILSNPFCILRTIGNSGSVKYVHTFDEAELEGRFSPEHTPVDSAAVNLEGRNVVIFIMESMSADHSAHLLPDAYADRAIKGFTPFLDSLMREGFCFRQMYANGTRSIQAMPAVLGSIPSFKTPFVLMPQSLGASRQLPAILADKGYETAFFCGSERGSMGFGAYARSAGVQHLYSREEYEQRHGKEDFDGYWGIWDEPFLQFAGEEFAALPEPFFAALFTISSHHPFYVPDAYATSLPAGYTAIHKSVAYDDQAFRHFFERYRHEAWFARTLFVFVADHVSSEKFAPESRTYPGNHHIIGFLYTPDGALRGSTDQVTQQIDLMPTVLGLLGNREPYFAFGRDVLNEPTRPAWSVSYDAQFRAVTRDRIVQFDEQKASTTLRATGATVAADTLEGAFKALIQQYYAHAERKSYIVK